jgi:malate synthase
VRDVVADVCAELGEALSADDTGLEQLDRARALFEQVALADDFADFLTIPAYDQYVP